MPKYTVVVLRPPAVEGGTVAYTARVDTVDVLVAMNEGRRQAWLSRSALVRGDVRDWVIALVLRGWPRVERSP